VNQLAETAAEELKQLRIQWDYDRSRTEPMLQALADALDPGRTAAPDRVLRHLQPPGRLGHRGDGRLRGRTAEERGLPELQDQVHAGPNDFAMLQEVLRRRLTRLESALRREDSARGGRPLLLDPADMILIDGGKGQLNAGLEVLEELGFADIPTFGLAKEREEIFVPNEPDPIVQEHDSPGMFLVQRVRDERTASPSRTTARCAPRSVELAPGLGGRGSGQRGRRRSSAPSAASRRSAMLTSTRSSGWGFRNRWRAA